MNKYVVSFFWYFTNELKQFLIYSESPREAIKEAILQYSNQHEMMSNDGWIEIITSNDFPKTIDGIKSYLANNEIVVEITIV